MAKKNQKRKGRRQERREARKQEQRMRWLAQLADTSLVFRVRRPWSLDRMHEVYEAICAHSRSLAEVHA